MAAVLQLTWEVAMFGANEKILESWQLKRVNEGNADIYGRV